MSDAGISDFFSGEKSFPKRLSCGYSLTIVGWLISCSSLWREKSLGRGDDLRTRASGWRMNISVWGGSWSDFASTMISVMDLEFDW